MAMPNSLIIKVTNLGHKVVTRVLRKAQSILGASTVGVRALILNEKQEILLIRHTYRPGWFFPGGGVNAGETPKQAVIRESYEEAGIVTKDDPTLLGIFYQVFMGVDDYVVFYKINNYEIITVNSAEIAEVKWYPYDQLPKDITPSTLQRLEEFFQKRPHPENW